MKIRNDELANARGAINAIRAYEHPRTRAGIRQDTTVKLLQLDRALREHHEHLATALQGLVARYGKERKPGQPETAEVAADSEYRAEFAQARAELMRAEVEVEDRLVVTLEELKVRNEDGELVPMELGAIGHLGPLLDITSTNGKKPKAKDSPAAEPAAEAAP